PPSWCRRCCSSLARRPAPYRVVMVRDEVEERVGDGGQRLLDPVEAGRVEPVRMVVAVVGPLARLGLPRCARSGKDPSDMKLHSAIIARSILVRNDWGVAKELARA